MKSPTLLRMAVACALGLATTVPVWAQSKITGFGQSSIDLYETPQLSAARQKIQVPAGTPGDDWRVLGTEKRFYQIQAGSHGVGWALRSQVTVDPDSPMVVAPCQRVVATGSQGPLGGTAGMGANSGC